MLVVITWIYISETIHFPMLLNLACNHYIAVYNLLTTKETLTKILNIGMSLPKICLKCLVYAEWACIDVTNAHLYVFGYMNIFILLCMCALLYVGGVEIIASFVPVFSNCFMISILLLTGSNLKWFTLFYILF